MDASDMRLHALTPMLRTRDLPGSLAFYCGMLGFECAAHDETRGWASLRRDGVELMLSGPNAHEGDGAPAVTGSLYFRTDAIDALWQRLQDRVRVCYPPEDFDYGMREFAVYDNNGYLLQFGSPVDRTGTA
jgi:uncharacterized glyoxalase superfamily protein PhnB